MKKSARKKHNNNNDSNSSKTMIVQLQQLMMMMMMMMTMLVVVVMMMMMMKIAVMGIVIATADDGGDGGDDDDDHDYDDGSDDGCCPSSRCSVVLSYAVGYCVYNVAGLVSGLHHWAQIMRWWFSCRICSFKATSSHTGQLSVHVRREANGPLLSACWRTTVVGAFEGVILAQEFCFLWISTI